uniref:Secreted protein n=1 Tax=Panagrolaimus sp. JU765 TaxID=591449 RepID=A0AC34Q1B5_9BILA
MDFFFHKKLILIFIFAFSNSWTRRTSLLNQSLPNDVHKLFCNVYHSTKRILPFLFSEIDAFFRFLFFRLSFFCSKINHLAKIPAYFVLFLLKVQQFLEF